ncbi:hypothetical protein [Aestuariibius sp. HNIBRBA575]|uniref:hypothetical protein n=1 Tax=Aestuariibius sp. HNIBRBA575 TaxID=3233343 RepID=UPI0034A341AC
MKRVLFLLPLIVAACATPREQCISSANSEVRVLTRLANVTRGNVERGYGIEEYQEFVEVRVACNVLQEDGTMRATFCDETQVRNRTRPVTINLAEERVKLRDLETRLAQEQRRANAAVQQCVAIHPE